MLALDAVQTLALAGLVLFGGYRLRGAFPVLARYNIPAPVVGGLVVAPLLALARNWGFSPFSFDIATQAPLMIAFFTSVGFGASLSLLKTGGPQVMLFLVAATVFAVAQNVVGIVASYALGVHPLFGVLCGSVTLTGGPATGLAFAPLFEQAGVPGAATVAVAAAMVGIVSGGLLGGPIGTLLIERHGLSVPARDGRRPDRPTAQNLAEERMREPQAVSPPGEDVESYGLLKNLVAMVVAMGIGTWVSRGFAGLGITLPAYIGAMLVASVIRNVDDRTRVIGLSQRLIDDLGNVSLSLFLAMALMTLKLWELAGLALPMLAILTAQLALVAVVCFWPMFPLMGRDYDSAVMAGGFCGFMLGTTANAMANMGALVERYGPAPRAFLVVPIVGAFFIDWTNALIITVCLNLFR